MNASSALTRLGSWNGIRPAKHRVLAVVHLTDDLYVLKVPVGTTAT